MEYHGRKNNVECHRRKEQCGILTKEKTSRDLPGVAQPQVDDVIWNGLGVVLDR